MSDLVVCIGRRLSSEELAALPACRVIFHDDGVENVRNTAELSAHQGALMAIDNHLDARALTELDDQKLSNKRISIERISVERISYAAWVQHIESASRCEFW